MDMLFRRIGFVSLLLLLSINTSALTIAFDDITVDSFSDIPDGYAGFDWQVYDEFGYHPSFIPDVSNDTYAETSGDYAFIGTGFSITRAGGGTFSVVDMIVANENCDENISFCTAGSVRLQGLNGGAVTFDHEISFDPNNLSSVVVAADFFNIEEFRVWNSAAEIMSLDNLRIIATPLPGALLFSLSSLSTLLLIGGRRRFSRSVK